MLAISLLILSICIGTIILIIHDRDEIHQVLAFLSGMMALVCLFVLTPPIIKVFLGAFFFVVGHKLFPIYSIFK